MLLSENDMTPEDFGRLPYESVQEARTEETQQQTGETMEEKLGDKTEDTKLSNDNVSNDDNTNNDSENEEEYTDGLMVSDPNYEDEFSDEFDYEDGVGETIEEDTEHSDDVTGPIF